MTCWGYILGSKEFKIHGGVKALLRDAFHFSIWYPGGLHGVSALDKAEMLGTELGALLPPGNKAGMQTALCTTIKSVGLVKHLPGCKIFFLFVLIRNNLLGNPEPGGFFVWFFGLQYIERGRCTVSTMILQLTLGFYRCPKVLGNLAVVFIHQSNSTVKSQQKSGTFCCLYTQITRDRSWPQTI